MNEHQRPARTGRESWEEFLSMRVSKWIALVALLCASSSALEAQRMMKIEEVLDQQHLTLDDIRFEPLPAKETIFNPLTYGEDPGRTVYEVWVKEKEVKPARPAEIRPARQLLFKDGSPVFAADKEQMVRRPVEVVEKVAVRREVDRDEKVVVTETDRMRYLTTSTPPR